MNNLWTNELTALRAQDSLKHYARALRTDNHTLALEVEATWGLYGYSPEFVSDVLGAVASGLPLDAAVRKAARGSG